MSYSHTLIPLLALTLLPLHAHAQRPLPIIDMHMHAHPASGQGADSSTAMLKEPPCSDPVWSPLTDQELMEQTPW